MFVPKDFEPKDLIKEDYIARKLTTRDVYLDYIAVMSSIDIIHETRSESWPTKELTIEDDLIDLGWHQREFEFKSSFAFTIMNKEQTECLGCIYFYPDDSEMSDANSKPGYDVNISWWCTQKMYDNGFYERLSYDIKEWVERDWPFEKVFYSNKKLPSKFNQD